VLSPTHHREGDAFGARQFMRSSITELRALRFRDNFPVLKNLPVTTLRTIDLAGKKNSDGLFSRFCEEMRVFFEGNLAPECVHENWGPAQGQAHCVRKSRALLDRTAGGRLSHVVFPAT
jgi:hypothetical protein